MRLIPIVLAGIFAPIFSLRAEAQVPSEGDRKQDAVAEDKPNAAWIAKDVEVAARVVAAMRSGELSMAELLLNLGADRTEEDREIGFGARRVRLAVYGGYTTTWVTILAHGDSVGPVEVICHQGNAKTWGAIRNAILPDWKRLAPEVLETGLRMELRTLSEPQKFWEERARILGEPSGVEAPAELAAAMRLLRSPLSRLTYGHECGESGDPPAGRLELETILTHKNGMPVLLEILRGPNPEGRLYAAEAILRLIQQGRTISEEVAQAIAWIRASKTPISVCRGCEISEESAEEPLKEMLGEAAGK